MQLLPEFVNEMLLVSDLEIKQAIRLIFETTRQVAEGAGAAGVAAVWKKRNEWKDKRIGVMLSGGNITGEQLNAILATR